MRKTGTKWLALALAGVLLLGLLAGCGETEETPEELVLDDTVSGETLTAGDQADRVFSLAVDYNQTLNPITTKSQLNQMVGDLVYDRLFDVDENFHVTSRILESWEYVKGEDSAGVFVLTVRPDIQMHDGSLLTAEDITYSLSRVFTSGASHYQLQMGRAYVSAYHGQVYLVGDYDNGLMIEKMAVPIIKSVTNSILEDVPIGSGPYTYSEDRQTLEKFDGYEFADDLPVDTIYLRPYEGPEGLITEYESSLVDLVLNDPTSIYNMGYGGKNETRSFVTTNLHFLCFNSQSEFFQYDAYRQAMNWIIDRESIAEDNMDGMATATALPIHPNSSLYDEEFAADLAFDPERCLLQLERGGCRDLDGDGMLEYALSGAKREIEINFLVCADSADKVAAARRIAADMESIGLSVHMRELTWEEYLDVLNFVPEDDEDEPEWIWDVYYGEISITGDWDVRTLFRGDKVDDRTLNYGEWSVPLLEQTMAEFIGATEEERPEAEDAMLQTLLENTVFLPVCFEKKQVLTHIGVVKGMVPNQYNVFVNLTNWQVDLG